MRGQWPVFSNLVYVAPFLVALLIFKLRLRAFVIAALAVVSSLYHWCAADATACNETFDLHLREADHALALFATCSLILLFVPFSSQERRAELVLHLVALAGSLAVGFGAPLDGGLSNLWPALVVIGVLALAMFTAWLIFRFHPLDYAEAMVHRNTPAIRLARLIGLLSLAASGVLWFTPDVENDSFAHAFWHVSTAIAATALLFLLASARETAHTHSDEMDELVMAR